MNRTLVGHQVREEGLWRERDSDDRRDREEDEQSNRGIDSFQVTLLQI